MGSQASQIRRLFDEEADHYDRHFSNTSAGEKLRKRTWDVADNFFKPGMRILDLGCGTGEDAIHFAERGVAVVGIDISPGMIAQLRSKAEALECRDRIHCVVTDLEHVAIRGTSFDGLFSNFAALNCSPDLRVLARLAQEYLKPGGRLIITLMGRFSPFETIVERHFRRWRGYYDGSLYGVPLRVYYHGLHSLRRALGPKVELEKAVGLNLFLPPPRPEDDHRFSGRVQRWLESMDSSMGQTWPCRSWGEHFISVWRFF